MLRRCCLRLAQGGVEGIVPQIAVVGAGPSGCYVADNLAKALPGAIIDVFEQLPVPFGLSRYGVAPDHPEVKNVEKKFMEMFESKRAIFLGNLALDRDYTIDSLLENYTAVVIASGAAKSRTLQLPGENLRGVISGKQLVDYYNTLPAPVGTPHHSPIDLSRANNVVIVGNGNVAIDCARFLGAPWKHWAPTDINKYAIVEHQKKRIKSINIVGRRGPEHLACTIAELRELAAFSSMRVRSDPFELEALGAVLQERPRRRLLELLHGMTTQEAHAPPRPDQIDVCFRFGRTPIKLLAHPQRPGALGAVIFAHSRDGEVHHELVECDALIYSIGYKSTGFRGVPFDEEKGVIPNVAGRVTQHPSRRLYCSGWVKRGPRGVMLQTMMDAKETAKAVADDILGGVAVATPEQRGKMGIVERLSTKGSLPTSLSVVKKIFAAERRVGFEMGKAAEKINQISDMLDMAMGGRWGKRAERRVLGLSDPRGNYRSLEDFLDEETQLLDVMSSNKGALKCFSPNKPA